ncbi:hypothetical protein HanIR_Chr12g0605821 [Helianthus annuus]|nr:hypothetical protein HanIR_Chr12g0605821 [Helianthus annuus]
MIGILKKNISFYTINTYITFLTSLLLLSFYYFFYKQKIYISNGGVKQFVSTRLTNSADSSDSTVKFLAKVAGASRRT